MKNTDALFASDPAIEIEARERDGHTTREEVARLRPTARRMWEQIDHENDGVVALGWRTANWSGPGASLTLLNDDSCCRLKGSR